jgi:peptidoglycan/xylan/chitin deacetylase (PgdA/CDA1 family)
MVHQGEGWQRAQRLPQRHQEGQVPEQLFALTNDDAGGENPHLFAELLDFLAAHEMVATFFVVPMSGGKPLDQKPEWLRLLERARAAGHELQLHALDHGSTFEFGVPPDFMLDIIPDAKAKWQKEPAVVQAEHTVANMGSKLDRGMEIFERALGYAPAGFRGPCLSMCDATYQALADRGFIWSSNLVVNPMGWRYINRDYDAGEPWQPDIPPHPFHYKSGLIEVPMLSEYTWYLKDEDIERHFGLIKDDFDRVQQSGNPFVSLSHYYAMTGKWAAGLRVYQRLLEHAQRTGSLRFCTLSAVVEKMQTGGRL